MEKETFKKILLYVTIIALIIGIILYIFEYAIPYKKYEACELPINKLIGFLVR